MAVVFGQLFNAQLPKNVQASTGNVDMLAFFGNEDHWAISEKEEEQQPVRKLKQNEKMSYDNQDRTASFVPHILKLLDCCFSWPKRLVHLNQ